MKPKRTKNVRREQPRKDNQSKRINLDNERISKFERDLDKKFSRQDSNDIRWYTKSAARLTAAARIPFSTIAGVTPVTEIDTSSDKSYTAAGVMSIIYTPNFLSNKVVVEQAFNGMYSDIVHANSRNQSYDMTDLAIMIHAGIEIFSAIGVGLRAFGLMKRYMEESLYSPEGLIQAAGFSYSDLRANYSHMWSDLLQLIAQSRQIWIPNTLPIVERRFWMNTQVYADADNSKPQYYLYTPLCFYKYSGFTDTKGGELVVETNWNMPDAAVGWTTRENKWSEYLSSVQNMIDALIPDQDRGIMYGDILKAYGAEKLFALNEIDLNYLTPVTYNQEVLWQFENITASGSVLPVKLGQENGHLVQQWAGISYIYSTNGDKYDGVPYKTPFLNFHQKEAPTPEQIAIATRMMAIGTKLESRKKYDGATKSWVADGGTGNQVCVPYTSGTEIVNHVKIYVNAYNEQGTLSTIALRLNLNSTSTPTNITSMIISQFDWHPFRYEFYKLASGASYDDYKLRAFIGDLENWTRLSKEELSQIHNAILYSLYNIPTLA